MAAIDLECTPRGVVVSRLRTLSLSDQVLTGEVLGLLGPDLRAFGRSVRRAFASARRQRESRPIGPKVVRRHGAVMGVGSAQNREARP
jgi:hypothetical protein